MFESYKIKAELYRFKKKWRAANTHNTVVPINVFDMSKITVGKGSYGNLNIVEFGAGNEGVNIGNFCSIARGVKFLLGGNHELSSFMVYPLRSKYKPDANYIEAVSKGKIVLEDDVWVGMDVIILSGVTIGKGAVIAAGAVVVKNVEPYSVVGGNPCKFIKKRFDDATIEKFMQIDFNKVAFEEMSVTDIDILQKPIRSEQDVENALSVIKAFKR